MLSEALEEAVTEVVVRELERPVQQRHGAPEHALREARRLEGRRPQVVAKFWVFVCIFRSFSAVSAPIFASKYALFSIF